MMRPTSNPRCRDCRFSCATCRWRSQRVRLGELRPGHDVLDMDNPRVVEALFTRPAGDLGDAMDRGDERCDAVRDDPGLYGSYDNLRD